MIENKKQARILLVVGILTLLVAVLGATYAYFLAQAGERSQTNVTVTTGTTDSLVFETGLPIDIKADQDSFAQGKGNRAGTTTAKAVLKANNTTNSATEHYNVYLSIDKNNFEYTTTEKAAELILTINKKTKQNDATEPVVEEVTTLEGLKYVTVGEVSGFDITEVKDLITIAKEHEITTTSTTEEEWEVTITLINLDSDQNKNTGKELKTTLAIQKEAVLAQYIKSLYTTQGANHLYHHDNTLALSAEDGSYRYAGGDYKVAEAHKSEYVTISDIIKFEVDQSTINETNKDGYYKYYLIYDTSKIYYDHPRKVVEKAVTDGYVEEDNVDNYVCFGSDAKECPYSNLYRIIGVYGNNVKLIKADYATEDELGMDGDFKANYVSKETWNTDYLNFEDMVDMPSKSKNTKYTSYYWNFVNSDATKNKYGVYNVWSESELNKTNLNKNYLNNLGTTWSNKITTTLWNVGGMTEDQGVKSNAKTAYDYEQGTNKPTTARATPTPYEAKVGLMYLSEYYYGALPTYWSNPGYNDDYKCISDNCGIGIASDYSQTSYENWIYMGDDEWTITPEISQSNFGFYIFRDSGPSGDNVDSQKLVRPAFNLKASVKYISGTGTSTDPYRIA